ncbi:hypothetical protein LX97_00504 [Nonlabens dokdonensis]|uniref:Uncharacterized protein n=2 Tax=Nonlabens dokdonensis TaxID=328515 RepID=L7W6U0_NONDD|nr:hypothetical protein [Nonlabens dokdonensis]AGC75819.1 hypothetical protein DDD_0692 [Nonlabens dokdonensis DSW-6]PZX43503.1 hypothetical protein LX97_00504 [Nonlabens dokdonensis]
MKEEIAQEVKDVLTTAPEEITFENIQGEESSPLNQPVIEKDIGGERPVDNDPDKQKSWNVWKPDRPHQMPEEPVATNSEQSEFRKTVEENVEQEKRNQPLDAPEQEINGGGYEDDDEPQPTDEDFELPLSQANQAADALLGMSNNVLEVGGGYFVKISKHKEFYEFDEIISVIDQQNDKNVARVKLDKEDKALLRPLLAQILRKKAKKLTPEQQLMGAVLSILMKKAQVVMEVRAENNILEERILDIIRDEKASAAEEVNDEVEEDYENEDFQEELDFDDEEIKTDEAFAKAKIEEPQTTEAVDFEEVDEDIPEATILEVAQDEPKSE